MSSHHGRPSLEQALASASTKRLYVRRLFSTIAGRYDLITRLLSYGADQRWKRRLMAEARIAPGMRVLDLACGTGDLAFAARSNDADVIGLDFAQPMINLARQKPGAGQIAWVVGDMGALPVSENSVDVVTTGYGLRNVPDLAVAIAEIHRVLRDGGIACSLDFDRPTSAMVRGVYLVYLTVVGSALGWALHGDPDTYRYIPASIRRYPGAAAVAEMMRNAGFSDVKLVPLLGGLMALHVATK